MAERTLGRDPRARRTIFQQGQAPRALGRSFKTARRRLKGTHGQPIELSDVPFAFPDVVPRRTELDDLEPEEVFGRQQAAALDLVEALDQAPAGCSEAQIPILPG